MKPVLLSKIIFDHSSNYEYEIAVCILLYVAFLQIHLVKVHNLQSMLSSSLADNNWLLFHSMWQLIVLPLSDLVPLNVKKNFLDFPLLVLCISLILGEMSLSCVPSINNCIPTAVAGFALLAWHTTERSAFSFHWRGFSIFSSRGGTTKDKSN